MAQAEEQQQGLQPHGEWGWQGVKYVHQNIWVWVNTYRYHILVG
jgi:hypothetical protein